MEDEQDIGPTNTVNGKPLTDMEMWWKVVTGEIKGSIYMKRECSWCSYTLADDWLSLRPSSYRMWKWRRRWRLWRLRARTRFMRGCPQCKFNAEVRGR